MRRILSLLAAVVLAGSSPAAAATITISATDGTWGNVVPIGNLDSIDNVSTTRTIRWGVDPNFSGYDYTPTAAPFMATIDGPAFLIGTFAHLNEPIPAGTSILSAELAFSLSWDGGFAPPLGGTFFFSHNETTNGANPCEDGGANGVGVNVNGCADSVTISSPFLNTEITNGTTTYFFSLLGFSQDGGLTTSSVFWTTEQQNNVAGLYGVITSVPIQLDPVPEPASLILIGSGLAGLAARARRRRS